MAAISFLYPINNSYKYLRVILIVAVMFFIGIERDLIFVSINKLIDILIKLPTYGLFEFKEKAIFTSFILLSSVKWYLTIFFYILYLSFACLSIYTLYKRKAYVYWTIAFFLSVIICAFIFMIIGYILNNYAMGYLFARKLMGLAQSPALLMILIPAFKLLKE